MTHKIPDPKKCEKPQEMVDFCLRSGLDHLRDTGGHGVYGNKNGSVAFPLHGLLSIDDDPFEGGEGRRRATGCISYMRPGRMGGAVTDAPLCPVCGQPERIFVYRHLREIVTDCGNAECGMCTDRWGDERIAKLVVDFNHDKLYD